MKNYTDFALSFDDVLVPKGYADFDPKEISFKTRLTKGNKSNPGITLNLPFISSPMDYVTMKEMAIAMGQNGGFGIIHAYLSVADQVEQVRKVKRYESFVIRDVYTISPAQTVGDLKKMMEEKNVSAFPVVIDNNKLLGIMTKRDVKNMDDSLRIEEAMTTRLNPREGKSDRKLITAKDGIDIKAAEKILYDNKIEKLPVVDENGILKGLITETDIMKRVNFPYATRDSEDRLMVGAAVNIDIKDPNKMFDRIDHLVKVGTDVLCIDTAHGCTKVAIDLMQKIKSMYEKIPVIPGNVVCAEETGRLIDAGADVIRVGLGSGGACVTRDISGVGMPQITAIQQCSEVADKYDVPVISDGGIIYGQWGRVTKAIAAGASSIMMGSIFAGTSESPAPEVQVGGERKKKYRGMGSPEALQKRADPSVSRYSEPKGGTVFEGVETEIDFYGPVSEVIQKLTGGLSAGMFYAGTRTIEELRKKGVQPISIASQKEGYHESSKSR